jgi:hypothetical protein
MVLGVPWLLTVPRVATMASHGARSWLIETNVSVVLPL